MQQELKMES